MMTDTRKSQHCFSLTDQSKSNRGQISDMNYANNNDRGENSLF